MADPNQPNQNPVLDLLDYELFLSKNFDEATANKSEVRILKDENGNDVKDAAGLPVVVIESSPDPYMHPLTNIEGGKKITNSLRLIMNKHNSFADLERDEIVDITADAVMQPIDMMMYNEKRYGVRDTTELETYGLQLLNSLYIYLNGLKKGGVREFNRGVLTVQYIQKPAGQEQSGVTGSLFNAK